MALQFQWASMSTREWLALTVASGAVFAVMQSDGSRSDALIGALTAYPMLLCGYYQLKLMRLNRAYIRERFGLPPWLI